MLKNISKKRDWFLIRPFFTSILGRPSKYLELLWVAIITHSHSNLVMSLSVQWATADSAQRSVAYDGEFIHILCHAFSMFSVFHSHFITFLFHLFPRYIYRTYNDKGRCKPFGKYHKSNGNFPTPTKLYFDITQKLSSHIEDAVSRACKVRELIPQLCSVSRCESFVLSG